MDSHVGVPVPTAAKLSLVEWRSLALLVSSVGINYIDRGSLSIAAPVLQTEMGLSPAQLGVLLSAFFWTYASFQLVSGWLVDRFPVNWVFGIGFLIWSVATATTGFASGLLMLIGLRVILGAGESVAYPSYSKIIANGFPEHHRGLTNALIDAGTKVGPAFGTLLGGLLVARFGWRFLFLTLGFGSLLWLGPWMLWAPKPATPSRLARGEGPSVLDILRQRSAWGSFVMLFSINYAWYFLLTWLPTYLVEERHFSMTMMAFLASGPLWGLATTTTFCGWASDRLIARGSTPTRVRKSFAATGLVLLTIMVPAAYVRSPGLSVVLIMLGCLSFGLCTANHWAISQTLSGPVAAGRWTGMQNAFGNMAGIAAPYLTGVTVAATGSYHYAFLLVAMFLLIGAASVVFVIGPVETVCWKGLEQLPVAAD